LRVSGSGFGVMDFGVEGLWVHGLGETLVWGQASRRREGRVTGMCNGSEAGSRSRLIDLNTSVSK